jgi:hypothetical protein
MRQRFVNVLETAESGETERAVEVALDGFWARAKTIPTRGGGKDAQVIDLARWATQRSKIVRP